MRKLWNWIRSNPNRAMFLVPIFLVAGISISHVVTWYDMANPINWAIYLSIAIEVGAMTALIAASQRVKGGVWFMFGLVTFIQMVGNIFYSYTEIDANGELFKSWVELTGPVWEMIGTEQTDIIGLKRWLALLEGGFLPIISLTSLHFFVKYDKRDREGEDLPETNTPTEGEIDFTEEDDIFDESLIDIQENVIPVDLEEVPLDNEPPIVKEESKPKIRQPRSRTNSKPRSGIKRID